MGWPYPIAKIRPPKEIERVSVMSGSRLKRQFVWREGAGNDSVVGYSGHWGRFLELS